MSGVSPETVEQELEELPKPYVRLRQGFVSTLRFFPPARVTWLALLALGLWGIEYLHGLGLGSLLGLPIVAVVTDLALQRVRFSTIRFPDAAIASALFLALILPPTVSIVSAGAIVFLVIVVRHSLRSRGRPWFNPATTGIVAGALLFGMSPAWWVALGPSGEYLMVGLGLLLFARSPGSWRLPVTFFLVYGILTVPEHVLFGAATSARVLILQAIDPAPLFFGLFMIPEPRTAPSAPRAHPLYAGSVAITAVFLPIVFPALGILLALLVGNGLAVALRRPEELPTIVARSRRQRTPPGRVPTRPSGRLVTSRRDPARWTTGRRVAAGLFAVSVVALLAAGSPGVARMPLVALGGPPNLGGGGLTNCGSDNPTIAASTLQTLHQTLGPSVILSYDQNSGAVVFYDPVNQVTVTETDLYEDYGYAEFNGDDFATSGCSA